MAVTSGQVTVTSSPAILLVPAATAVVVSYNLEKRTRRVVIRNGSGGGVYLGPSGVTTGNGFPLAASAEATLELYPDETVYAIASGSSSVVGYIESGS